MIIIVLILAYFIPQMAKSHFRIAQGIALVVFTIMILGASHLHRDDVGYVLCRRLATVVAWILGSLVAAVKHMESMVYGYRRAGSHDSLGQAEQRYDKAREKAFMNGGFPRM